MNILEAANQILNLANSVQGTDEQFKQFREAALALADDYVETINCAFLLDVGFEQLEDNSFKADFDFVVKETDFGFWESNLTLAGVPITFHTKDQLMETLDWLNLLYEEDGEELE